MSIRKVTAELISTAPYSQSKQIAEEAKPNESPIEFEKRSWRSRMHVGANGKVFIPGMQVKKALEGAPKYTGEKIKGKGKATYTKNFKAGVILNDLELDIGVNPADVFGEALSVPSDGVAGSGKRVTKIFPRIDSWKTKVSFTIIDDAIDAGIFKKLLETAGILIGLGRWRPINGGMYGRFKVGKIDWEIVEE